MHPPGERIPIELGWGMLDKGLYQKRKLTHFCCQWEAVPTSPGSTASKIRFLDMKQAVKDLKSVA